MPIQKIAAWVTMAAFDAPCLFRKNDMVIGIMGNTQGVKIEASPKPKATPRKASSEVSGSAAVVAVAGPWLRCSPAGSIPLRQSRLGET